jgi:hypothetical protein
MTEISEVLLDIGTFETKKAAITRKNPLIITILE